MGQTKREKVDVEFLVDRFRRELPRLRRQYAVRSLGMFGSYVRGEHSRLSDLDILVDFSEVPGMLKFLDLERDLSRIAGVPVDLVQKDALKPAIGKRILEEVVPL